jgi:hypothetical protein
MVTPPQQTAQACEAGALFNPDRELPPHGAIELYHEPPPVLSMIHTIITTAGGEDPHGWAPAAQAAWTASRDAAIEALRQHLYIKVGTHYPQQLGNSVGKYWPARLRISSISHLCHPETEPFAQMHDHIYIHPTAYPDNTPTPPTLPLPEWEADQPWPIDRYSLAHETADMVVAMSGIAAQNTFTELTGAVWSSIPHINLPATLEGFEADTQTYPRFICPGPQRAAPDGPTSWADYRAAKIAENPGRWNDMLEEQRREFTMRARAEFNRLGEVDRIILIERVYPRLRDVADRDER